MKSKAEIADALQIHMLAPDCKGCAYISEFNEEEHPCYMSLINDAVNILSKSDFEVMKEILERSEEYHNDYSYEIQGSDYHPAIILHRGTQMLWVDFDDKGNIL